MNQIKFTQPTELEVVTHYDEEADKAHTVNESFKEGEVVEVDITYEHETSTDFQFPNGNMAYCVDNSCFELMQNEDANESV